MASSLSLVVEWKRTGTVNWRTSSGMSASNAFVQELDFFLKVLSLLSEN